MSTAAPYRIPPGVERVTVRTPRGDLAGLRAGGADGEPVLLVPGFTGSKEDFLAVLLPLAGAGHPVLAIDQLGQFESPGPDDEAAYTVPALAGDVLAAAASLGTPVHLVGHSFGGLVARAAALADPAAVRSLVLMDTGAGALPGLRAQRVAALRPLLLGQGVGAVWTATRAADESDPGWVAPDPERDAFLRGRFLANSPAGLLGMGQALITEPDRTGELAAVDRPMLVVHGAAEDEWPPPLQVELAHRLGVDRVVVPASRHSPAAENPAVTARVLIDFFAGAAGRA